MIRLNKTITLSLALVVGAAGATSPAPPPPVKDQAQALGYAAGGRSASEEGRRGGLHAAARELVGDADDLYSIARRHIRDDSRREERALSSARAFADQALDFERATRRREDDDRRWREGSPGAGLAAEGLRDDEGRRRDGQRELVALRLEWDILVRSFDELRAPAPVRVQLGRTERSMENVERRASRSADPPRHHGVDWRELKRASDALESAVKTLYDRARLEFNRDPRNSRLREGLRRIEDLRDRTDDFDDDQEKRREESIGPRFRSMTDAYREAGETIHYFSPTIERDHRFIAPALRRVEAFLGRR